MRTYGLQIAQSFDSFRDQQEPIRANRPTVRKKLQSITKLKRFAAEPNPTEGWRAGDRWMSNLEDNCTEPISAPSRFNRRTGRGARHLTKRACTKRIISICLGLKKGTPGHWYNSLFEIHFIAEIQVVPEKMNKNRLLISIAPRS